MAITESTSVDQSKVVTHLHFLAKDPKYDTVKPYTARFDTDGKFPFTNIENVRQNVEITFA